jgi:uroporphyrinogen-III synthase
VIGAVGRATARRLEALLGRPPELLPAGRFDSEGLLALERLRAVAGERILIVRGAGGREKLAETLRARGAAVDYLEVYRRVLPPLPERLPDFTAGEIDVVTTSSGEVLENLLALLPQALHPALKRLPLLVVSERSQMRARELGFSGPILLADSAHDGAVVAALLAWRADGSDNE